MSRPNSWSHEIRALSLVERAQLEGRGLACRAPRPSRSKSHCGDALVVECSYLFASGVPGVAETAQRTQCEFHGRAFAETYGLTFPDLPELPEAEPVDDEVAS